jgi:hypothetical protein
MGTESKEPEMVTITKEEYDQLLKDSQFLLCLEGAGVDNWQGYGDAQDAMNNLSDE